MNRIGVLVGATGLALLLGCGKPPADQAPAGDIAPGEPSSAPAPAATTLSGDVTIDGSSTVEPISSAVAEEFGAANAGVHVTVGTSGTGGGFKKFCAGETDISDASRPIKSEEIEAAKAKGIEFIELPVAFDGLSVVVNPQNDWVDKLTVEELKKIWEPGSKITNWKDVRPGFPDVPLKLYGPGTDSGTFDYFTDAIVGEEGSCRSDFSPSEDDNVLVQGVAGDKGALGYFGYAYYVENQDKLKLVPIQDGDAAPVAPSEETINNGTYTPLSRPLFIYVSRAAADKPQVEAFVRFYLDNVSALLSEVGYVPLPDAAMELIRQRFEQRKTGSVFSGGSQPGTKIEDILAKES